jgi:hypothetical protein
VVYMMRIDMCDCIHVECSSGSDDDRHTDQWTPG